MIIRKEDIMLNEANVYLKDKKDTYAVNVWVNKGGIHRPRLKVSMGPKFNNDNNVSVGFEPTTNQIIKIEDQYFRGNDSELIKCINVATAFIVFAADILRDGYESPSGLDQKEIDKREREFNKISSKEFNALIEKGRKNAKKGVKFE